jgi:hypothetical protein
MVNQPQIAEQKKNQHIIIDKKKRRPMADSITCVHAYTYTERGKKWGEGGGGGSLWVSRIIKT